MPIVVRLADGGDYTVKLLNDRDEDEAWVELTDARARDKGWLTVKDVQDDEWQISELQIIAMRRTHG
jgi:hypothetical protein